MHPGDSAKGREGGRNTCYRPYQLGFPGIAGQVQEINAGAEERRHSSSKGLAASDAISQGGGLHKWTKLAYKSSDVSWIGGH